MAPRKKPHKKKAPEKKKASGLSRKKRNKGKSKRKAPKRKGRVAPKAERRGKSSPHKRVRPIAPKAAKKPKASKPKKAKKRKPRFTIEDVPHYEFPDGTIELALEAKTIDELDSAARELVKQHEGWFSFEAIVKKPPAEVDVDEYRIGKGRYGIRFGWRGTEYRGGSEYHYSLLDFKTAVLNLGDIFKIQKLVFRFYNGKEKP